MMPAALANAVYDQISYAPPLLGDWQSGSNVVAVDFRRRRAAPVEHQHSSVDPGSEQPEWQKAMSERLGRLRQMPDGWDGASSLAVPHDVLAKADRLLTLAFNGVSHPAPPATVPCADGTLQLEWWLVDTRFELSIEADGAMEGWGLDRESGHEASATGTKAFELLRKWSARLTADKLAVAN